MNNNVNSLEQPYKGYTMRQSFVLASLGPHLVKLLSQEENPRWEASFGEKTADLLQGYKENSDQATLEKTIIPICSVILEKIYPNMKAVNRTPEMMNWLFTRLIEERHNNKPILAEDYDTVTERINAFNGLKNTRNLTPPLKEKNITKYPNFDSLDSILKPYLEIKKRKEEERLKRHLSAEKKARIARETTILYDGVEGKVVIPHTPFASQYWGNNTKWCISGNEAEMHFPGYNDQDVIMMLLPKNDKKYALVEKMYYNEEDKFFEKAPERHIALYNEMLETYKNRPNIYNYLSILGSLTPQKPDEKSNRLEASLITRLTETQQQWFDAIIKTVNECQRLRLPNDISKDKQLFVALVQQNGRALRYAHGDLRKDRDVVLAAVQQKGWVLAYGHADLYVDFKFMQSLYDKAPHIFLDESVDGIFCQKELKYHQIKVLEMVINNGDVEKLQEVAHRFEECWGDAKTLFDVEMKDGLRLKAEKLKQELGPHFATIERSQLQNQQTRKAPVMC